MGNRVPEVMRLLTEPSWAPSPGHHSRRWEHSQDTEGGDPSRTLPHSKLYPNLSGCLGQCQTQRVDKSSYPG